MAWNPDQYERFRDERSAPFFDLLSLVRCDRPTRRVVDLGCGTGELTSQLHHAVGAAHTLGLDSSASMLARSGQYAAGGLHFEQADIANFAPEEPYDLVFSNAALQWVPDHPALFERLTRAVAPGGQLAVQVPANQDHPSHLVAHQLAAEEPFRTALDGYLRPMPVLRIEEYSALLYRLGYAEQHVRTQVYLHLLDGPHEVLEWAKGTLLTDYEKRLSPEMFQRYLAAYGARLLPRLPQERPYLYPFKRTLLWGRRPHAN